MAAAGLAIGIFSALGGPTGMAAGVVLGLIVGVAGAVIVSGIALAQPARPGAEIEQDRCGPIAAALPFTEPEPYRLGEIRDSMSEILSALSSLDHAAGRMAEGAIVQAGAVPRTTQTVEALYDKIDRISQNAEEAADATDRTRQQAIRGLEQIRGVIEGMDRLRSQVEANARKARRLGERSVEIGAIVELIGEVSNRTDMLALNATIESVRAGEHGRGFAVVAEEIRKLAERAAGATREVGTLVEAIQADTHESIRSLAEEQAEMEQEARSVKEAGSALERISRMAEDSARLVDGISHSANDQVLAARDLVSGMQRVSEVSRLILGETKQLRQETQGISARCQSLNSQMANLSARNSMPITSGVRVAEPTVLSPSPSSSTFRSIPIEAASS